ncbi:hypothetical protein IEO70_06690 [Bacillus sp. AGMB 02131]|uniref:BclA C-terminal domain-containing protein n=1 Tax=Peribacillus faecalis TaxID=2772559 RepID=A0A927H9X6_9BACI|nr:hypothetical protein [Peribacillus faecalis]MBD3108050.1 hypothetical protein [Peribacillus faecalis]
MSNSSSKRRSRRSYKVLVYASYISPTPAIAIPANSAIPFNNQVFAKNATVNPPFGILIQESGIYGITFNVTLAAITAETTTFEIFRNNTPIATVTVPTTSTVAKVATIDFLRCGDILSVRTPTGATVLDANLTAAKID